MTESMEPEDDDGNMSETSLPGGFHAIWVHVYVSCLGNTTDAFSTPGKKKSVRSAQLSHSELTIYLSGRTKARHICYTASDWTEVWCTVGVFSLALDNVRVISWWLHTSELNQEEPFMVDTSHPNLSCPLVYPEPLSCLSLLISSSSPPPPQNTSLLGVSTP